MSPELYLAAPADLDAATLYRILRLRVDVFVVEQQCPYPELDGRDLEPGTRWLWAADGGQVLATLRILREDARTARIGRVATARSARSTGIATLLMRRALDILDSQPEGGLTVVLDAQSPLAGWYQRFGFELAGAEFVEDGISHLPMRRPSPAGPRDHHHLARQADHGLFPARDVTEYAPKSKDDVSRRNL